MKLTVYAPFSRTPVVHLLPFLLATVVGATRAKPPPASRNSRQGLLQDSKKINPKLDPKSDRVFFGHDYPDDIEPLRAKKTEFSHPYPAVQDTDEYDKDFVKDENNDNGEWKAQMDYDLLRTRVARQKDDLEKAKDAEREMQERLEAARKREEEAAKAAKEAAERAAKAKDHADSLKKTAKDKEDQASRESKKVKKSSSREQEEEDLFKEEEEQEQETHKPKRKDAPDDDSDDIDKAVANVKKEMSDLKICEKELVAARKELKEAMAKADKAAVEKQAKDAAAHAEWMKNRDNAARRADMMAAEAAKYKSAHARRVAEEEARKEALEKKEAEYAEAKKDFNQAGDKLKETEGDMKKAADKLRNFRRVEDIGGGVSWRPPIDPKTGQPVSAKEAARIQAEEAAARRRGQFKSGSISTSCSVTLLLVPALFAFSSTS